MSKNIHSHNDLSEVCNLSNSINKIVVSRGNPLAKLMIIGEAPGAKEEELGEPFVGRSGKLLDKLLQNAGININLDVYFCNVVKCRPPNNRRPTKTEIHENLPWLYQQIKLVDPHILILVGATSLEAILKIKSPISVLRGKWINWEGRLVMPVFHPSYLLRNPSKEKGTPMSFTQSDFSRIKKKLIFYKRP